MNTPQTPTAEPLAPLIGSAMEEDVRAIVAGMLKRNPQLKAHVGQDVSLEEFGLAVVIQYKARTAHDQSPSDEVSHGSAAKNL